MKKTQQIIREALRILFERKRHEPCVRRTEA